MLTRLLLVNFRLVHGVDRWLKRRLTGAGMLVLGGMGTAGVFGLNMSATLGAWLFALGGALLAMAMSSALAFRGRFSVSRDLPRYGTVGEPLAYRVTVTHHSRGVQRGLALEERFEARVPGREAFTRCHEPGHRRRNFHVGYPRWAWLMARAEGAVAAPIALPALPSGLAVEIEGEIVPLRRGRVRFAGADITCADPLGLFRAIARSRETDSLLILPRRYPVRWEAACGRQADSSGDAGPARALGGSAEFATIREYRPGDPLRHIHWRSWARLGQPVVKEFQDQSTVRHALVLDTFAPVEGATFEAAVSVAASLASAARAPESRLDLMLAGSAGCRFSAGRGLATRDRLLEVLACVQVCRDAPFRSLADWVVASAPGMSACVCVLLGWDRERQALVRRLQCMGVTVTALVVSAGAWQGSDVERSFGGLRFVDPAHVAETLASLDARRRDGVALGWAP